MPRKKKSGGFTMAFESNPEIPENAPTLALLISPHCPFCKQLLKYSVTRHYISKGVLKVYDIKNFPSAGDWVLTENGLVYRLVTPTFAILCDKDILHKEYPHMAHDLEGFVRSVVYLYVNTFINIQCKK